MKSRGRSLQTGISDIRTIAYSDKFGPGPTLSLNPIYTDAPQYQREGAASFARRHADAARQTAGRHKVHEGIGRHAAAAWETSNAPCLAVGVCG